MRVAHRTMSPFHATTAGRMDAHIGLAARADARFGLGADRLELTQRRARMAMRGLDGAESGLDADEAVEGLREALGAQPEVTSVAHGSELHEAALRLLS